MATTLTDDQILDEIRGELDAMKARQRANNEPITNEIAIAAPT